MFRDSRDDEYVDKSGLIAFVNKTLFKERRFNCVTRCRRFGKSMAAKMLCAYYDSSCDSRTLFEDLEIAQDPTFEKHLNKYPVIYLDMTTFITQRKDDQKGNPITDKNDGNIVDKIDKSLQLDIHQVFPDVPMNEKGELMDLLMRIYLTHGIQFIFIIDEWDAICREYQSEPGVMDRYVNWLRRMFKSVDGGLVFAGVYLTGILPIKKYNTESALNNFKEYSMIDPGTLGSFFGFTEEEVRALATKHNMDFDELAKWYDGYQIGDQPSMFNPNSVMEALNRRRCRSYWSSTGAFTSVAKYINMNFEGLKDAVINMLAGGRCPVKTNSFQNDTSTISCRDDVLTVLIHLGYLTYDWDEDECYIPNHEVAGEMEAAVKANNWEKVMESLEQSKALLQATLSGDEEAVAAGIESVHDENTSILSYNNENSLSCVISLAYYYARNDYIIHREYPSGKGVADLVLIPRKHVTTPAIIIELKKDKAAGIAIDQIKARNYIAKVSEYADNLLLVGINYDTKTKKHTCKIEKACF